MLAAAKGEVKLVCGAFWLKNEIVVYQLGQVAALLEAGANVDSQDKWGQTPIFHASKCGCLENLRYLVEKGGADVHHRDNRNNTAFMIADQNNMCMRRLFTST